MRREFICHRCGTANHRGSENCSYCGLQVGWRPSFPDSLRFWRWPRLFNESVGSLAAPLAAMAELTYSGAWATYLLSLPLVTLSALTLCSHFFTAMPDTEHTE